MNRNTLAIAAAVLGLSAGITLAQQDEGPRRQGPRDGEGRRAVEGDRPAGQAERGRERGPRAEGDRGNRAEGERGPRGEGDRGPRAEGRREGPGGPAGIMALARFDADNDGKLSDDELAALRTEYETRHQQLVKEHDTDGDGKLSPEERREAGQRRRGPGGPEGDRPEGAMREELIKQFDTDGDGQLNDDERAAARGQMQQRRQEMLQKHDKDGDGQLSREERQAARAEREGQAD